MKRKVISLLVIASLVTTSSTFVFAQDTQSNDVVAVEDHDGEQDLTNHLSDESKNVIYMDEGTSVVADETTDGNVYVYPSGVTMEVTKNVENEIVADSNEGYIIPEQYVADSNSNYNIPEEYINVNSPFYLNTTSFTAVASENNTFNKDIRIQSSTSNTQNIAVEVRNNKNALLGQNGSIAPGYGVNVSIPFDSGTYTVYARTLSSNGYVNLVIYDL